MLLSSAGRPHSTARLRQVGGPPRCRRYTSTSPRPRRFDERLLTGNTLKDHAVTVLSDYSTAVAHVNQEGGTRSPPLLEAAWGLLLCDSLHISLGVTHLAGKQNVVADALSRGKLNNNEWELSLPWAVHVFSLYGRPNVDLFATHLNAKLPTFCSRTFHPLAWRTEAFAFPWNDLVLYAFPPRRLIHRVLATLSSSSADMVLICPFWPNQP